MRYILFVSVAIGLVLLYLLSLASANTAISGDYYKILLYINIALAGALVCLLAFNYGFYIKKLKVVLWAAASHCVCWAHLR